MLTEKKEGYIGVPGSGLMEKKMETTTVHWGHIGIMENKMETAIQGLGSEHIGKSNS